MGEFLRHQETWQDRLEKRMGGNKEATFGLMDPIHIQVVEVEPNDRKVDFLVTVTHSISHYRDNVYSYELSKSDGLVAISYRVHPGQLPALNSNFSARLLDQSGLREVRVDADQLDGLLAVDFRAQAQNIVSFIETIAIQDFQVSRGFHTVEQISRFGFPLSGG